MLSTSPEYRNWSVPPVFACGAAVGLEPVEPLLPLLPQAARTSARTTTLHRTPRSLSNASQARQRHALLKRLESIRLDGAERAGPGNRLLRRPGQKRRAEVIWVDSTQVDLGQFRARLVIRLR